MTALGGLFKGVLEKAVGSAVVFDYGNSADFGQLWDAGNGTPAVLSELNGKRAVIIVWDGRTWNENDDKEKLLAPHLTPLDWALAFSIKVLGDTKTTNRSNFHIHIVDLTGKAHDKWAMRMRYQLLAEMPWVTLHAPLIPKKGNSEASYRQGYRPILEDGGLLISENSAWQLNKKGITLAAGSNQGRGKDLVGLARQWAASLTQSHDHHDLNNVVGPRIVLSRLDSAIVPLASTTPSGGFYARLEWMGLLPGKIEGGYQPPPLKTPLDVLAIDDEIDDELDNDWGGVLQRLLGLSPVPPSQEEASVIRLITNGAGVSLYGCKNPEALLASLGIREGGAAIDETLYRSRTFDSPLRKEKEGVQRPWLLVLDLHLFSGQQQKGELGWFQTLRKAAEKFVNSNGLAWPGFLGEEIGHLNTWLGNPVDREDTAYDTALSLLPRLCALRWPSVPIIVFSGTGRRTLIAKMAEYRNIFLASPKPNVLAANSSDQLEAFLDGWTRSVQSASSLLSVQDSLSKLCSMQSNCSQSGPERLGSGTSPSPSTDEHRHLTIAFDETGNFSKDPYSAIGGVIIEITACNKDEAQRASSNFFEELRKNGVNFYDYPPAYTEIESTGLFLNIIMTCIPKNSNITNKVKTTLLSLNKNDTMSYKISAFRCLIQRELYDKYGQYSDGTYLAWLSATVELLLAEYLPSLNYNLQKTSLSLWFPTRSVHGKSAEAMRCDFNFFTTQGGKDIVETIGGRSVAYAILTMALTGRRCFETTVASISGLKIRKIPYFQDPDKLVGQQYDSARHWYCTQCRNLAFEGYPKTSLPAFSTLLSQQPKKLGRDQRRKCETHASEFLVADYTMAAHLADASLSMNRDKFPNDELGRLNIDIQSSFDVEAGGQLNDFLHVGRLFDQGLSADGFKVAYKHEFFVKGIRKHGEAHVERRLVSELAEYAKQVDGNTLIELPLAGLPTRGTS